MKKTNNMAGSDEHPERTTSRHFLEGRAIGHPYPSCSGDWLQSLHGANLACVGDRRNTPVTGTLSEIADLGLEVNFFGLSEMKSRSGRRIMDGKPSPACLENCGPLRYMPYYNPLVPAEVQLDFLHGLSNRYAPVLILRCINGFYAFFRAAGKSSSYFTKTANLFRGYGSTASFRPWGLHPFPGGSSKTFGLHSPIFWDPTSVPPPVIPAGSTSTRLSNSTPDSSH